MHFNLCGSIWELMLVQRPSGTRFSQSSTPRGKSPLARNDDNTLVTHGVLFDGNKAVLGVLSVGVVVGVMVGVAAVKAAPHVKSGLVSFKSKLSRRAEETADVEAPAPLTVVAEVEPEQPDAPRLRAV